MRFFTILLFLGFCTCVRAPLTANGSVPPVSHPDADALIALYNATDGDNWTDNTNWLEPTCDVCTWYGVTCNSNDRVTRLDLSGNNLSGELPGDIGGLTQLESLRLASNNLTGEIPATINSLGGLEELLLTFNDLEGELPDMGNLGRLRNLQAGGNNLEGALPASLLGLGGLERLYLSANNFSGPWPDLNNLTSLRQLYLTNNDFSGPLPALSGVLPDLFEIGLAGNAATGDIPVSWESSLPALVKFDAALLGLTGSLPDVGGWPLLEEYYLGFNDFSGCYPSDYDQLCAPGVAFQFTGNPQLPDGGSDDFFTNAFCANGTACGPCLQPDIDALIDFYNATNGSGWDAAVRNSGWADGAAGTNCEPCTWDGITCNGAGRVTRISLLNKNLTGTLGISSWTDLDQLEQLGLSLNAITGNFPQALWFLDELEQINLQDCDLGGDFPNPGSRPALRVLDIGGNNFFGGAPIFGNCPELTTVILFGNDFTDLGQSNLNVTSTPSLTTLAAQDNSFFEFLPESLGGFPAGQLSLLRLDDNDFQGCYPASYSTLCGANTFFTGNADLPAGGSDDFFDDEFCQQGIPCDPGCHPDYAALVDFYNSTNGDSWTSSTGWLEDCDVCDWQGVTCSGGRVTELTLFNNNLTGTLPQSMIDLEQLEVLRVDNNAIGGSIPQELAGLSSMRVFNVRVNQLTGSVPATLSQWTQLETYQVGSNMLSGPLLRLPNSPNLTDYATTGADFTGPIPEDLVASPVINRIALGNNALTGPLPELFGNLPSLTQLFLAFNDLEGCYPANYSNLCGINSTFFQNAGLPDAGSDDFFDNVFCVTGQACEPCDHPDFEALIALYDATDGPNWTVNTGWVDGAAGTDCDVCNWEGILCNADNRVRSLRLDNNNLSGPIPPELADLTELEILDLSTNDFTPGPLPDLSNSPGLVFLRFSLCDLTGPFPAWVVDLPAIGTINFNGNDLDGPLPDLSGVSNLVSLVVSNNEFTGSLPDLGSKPLLNDLGFRGNQFTGPIPASWTAANFPELTQLNANENQLSGPLPAALGDLPSLANLGLRNNNFDGCYPASYINLCDNTTNFTGNPSLPDGGSDDFFENQFCVNPGVCNTLPVSWVSFTARPVGKTVELDWVTAEETDNAGFIVERSPDGQSWVALSTRALVYDFVDERPLTGTSFYRIRQTDFDGTVSYSEVRQVSFTGPAVTAYPNPFSGQLMVVSEEADEIRVTDLTGRTVTSFLHRGDGAQVQGLRLPAGVYVLHFARSGQVLRVVAR